MNETDDRIGALNTYVSTCISDTTVVAIANLHSTPEIG